MLRLPTGAWWCALLLAADQAQRAAPAEDAAATAHQAGSCRRYISRELWSTVWAEFHSQPVVLYGIEGSASVALARRRLRDAGTCFAERLSPDEADPLIAYMRCEVWVSGGATYPFQLDSFLWIGGRFRGDGYLLSPPSDGGLPDPLLHGLVAEAGGDRSCAGDDPCDPDALTGRASQVTAVCCEAVECDPWPTSCGAACMEVWLPFWGSCYAELSVGMVSDEPALRALTNFAMLCGGGKRAGATRAPAAAQPAAPATAVASAEQLAQFQPLCGPRHVHCSVIPIPQNGDMPVGVWDVERCTGGDRFVCFIDTDGSPALFVDESVRWWEGAPNAQGQTTETIRGNVKQPSVGCVVPTDACLTGEAVAVAVETHPHNRCVLGYWRYLLRGIFMSTWGFLPAVFRPFRTVFPGLGAGFLNLGAKTEGTAKKRRKNGGKWARNGLKRVGVS